MASLLIRSLSENDKSKLRVQAAEKGRSMDEEAASLIREGLKAPKAPTGKSLFAQIREIFGDVDGGELVIPPRDRKHRPPPDFSGPEHGE